MKKNCYLLFAISFVGLLVPACSNKTSPSSSKLIGNKQSETKLADSDERNGVMTKEASMKRLEIEDRVVTTAAITDQDLDWILAELKKPSLKPDTPLTGEVKTLHLVRSLTSVKSPTDSQKSKINEIVRCILSHPDNSPTGVTYMFAAAIIERTTRDPQLIPALLPLLNDKRETVQKEIKKTLATLGYKSAA